MDDSFAVGFTCKALRGVLSWGVGFHRYLVLHRVTKIFLVMVMVKENGTLIGIGTLQASRV